MDIQTQPRLLIKILIGVAWLDGEIKPEERQYLAKVAKAHDCVGVGDSLPLGTASLEENRDPEVEALLTSPNSVTLAECEQWIQTYLGDRSINDDDELIEAISGLIYSDGDVAVNEAKLLVNIQSVPSSTPPIISKIRQLYRKALECRL